MATLLSPILGRLERAQPCQHDKLVHWCPACRDCHEVPLSGSAAWGYNGDAFFPTLSPSVKVVYGMGGDEPDAICHYHLRNGEIMFCTDSTHSLAGHTVPMEPIPADEVEEMGLIERPAGIFERARLPR